jgi:phage tail-like protein
MTGPLAFELAVNGTGTVPCRRIGGFRGRGPDDPSTAFPLSPRLPALLRDDPFLTQFCAGLDGLLAHVLEVLDSLAAYLDPDLAPLDFLRWLGTWVGVEIDSGVDEDRQREAVKRALPVHRYRGTATGMVEAIELETGLRAEIEDSGSVTTSQTPSVRSNDQPPPLLLVRVRAARDQLVDMARLQAAIDRAKPAHTPHQVEVCRDDRLSEVLSS